MKKLLVGLQLLVAPPIGHTGAEILVVVDQDVIQVQLFSIKIHWTEGLWMCGLKVAYRFVAYGTDYCPVDWSAYGMASRKSLFCFIHSTTDCFLLAKRLENSSQPGLLHDGISKIHDCWGNKIVAELEDN